jgi:uncharacterized protein
MDMSDESLDKSLGIVHLNGSILCFPNAAYMWNVRNLKELTIESLAPIALYRPKLEYLFLGSEESIHPSLIDKIREGFAKENNELVVEPMDLVRLYNEVDSVRLRVCLISLVFSS